MAGIPAIFFTLRLAGIGEAFAQTVEKQGCLSPSHGWNQGCGWNSSILTLNFDQTQFFHQLHLKVLI